MCLAYCFHMLAMGVFTTVHWQTSGRLVQEMSVLYLQSGFPQTVDLVSRYVYVCETIYTDGIASILMPLMLIWTRQNDAKTWKMTGTLAHGLCLSDSAQRELSNEYLHGMVKTIFKILCFAYKH